MIIYSEISFFDKQHSTTLVLIALLENAADEDTKVVTWWEINQTTNEPVSRISTDAGQTFGPILNLATNGTIGQEVGGEEKEVD
jgi:hypothetical protein